MGSLFNSGGGGGGGGGGYSQPAYVQPPAPGTLVQTVLSGNPNPKLGPAPPIPETDEERKRRLNAQNSILGGSDPTASQSGPSGQGEF